MTKIAILPLRKGSKGIPGKNKKKMLGRPLFCWTLSEAVFSDLDKIYVFTDDTDIISFVEREYSWTDKISAVLRNDENACDTASTESAMQELAEKLKYDFEVFCLLQATSPLTTAADINKVLEKVSGENDAALTVVRTHRFTWSEEGQPLNYDVYNRPRRQDFGGLLIENGAIYATTVDAYKNSKNRVSGKIAVVEMPEETLMEIDSISDWEVIENLLAERQKRFKQQRRIDYLVLDVDGVFTDGCVYYDANGEMAKKFDMRDGMGLEILRQHHVQVVVITSENSPLVAARMKKLQIENVFLGVKDKFSLLAHFLQEKNSSFGALAYVGDDVNDLANICAAGWSFVPADGTEIVKRHGDFVLSHESGDGAIREVCEIIIKYNKRYEQL